MHSMAPWCVLGDFNEIIKQEEKHGGHPRPAKQMEGFKLALEANGLFDLGWQDTKYTWSNRHTDNTFTKLRLDKVVATKEWIDKFGYQKVEVLATARSDHQLIHLSNPNSNYSETIWKQVQNKLKSCSQALSRWSSQNSRESKKVLEEKIKKLKTTSTKRKEL